MKTIRNSLLISALLLILTAAPGLAALGDYFISTDELAHSEKTVVVDVRNQAKYLLGHIDGALHLDRDRFLDKRRGVKSLIPTVTQIQELLDSLGIKNGDTVVAYADDDNPYGARFVWTLRFHGHRNAYVLDGGYEKWAAENRPTAILPTSPEPTTGYKVSANRDIRAEAEEVFSKLGSPEVVVWDTRTPEEYTGEKVRADRGGHIPGATHLNWLELQKEVDGVRVLKSEREIRELLLSKGITSNKQVLAHCQTGIRSSYATLVLLGLGYQSAKNYDGSWIEWANSQYYPVVEGHGDADPKI